MDSNLQNNQPKKVVDPVQEENLFVKDQTTAKDIVEPQELKPKPVVNKQPELEQKGLIGKLKDFDPQESLLNNLVDKTKEGSKINNFLTNIRDDYLIRADEAEKYQKEQRKIHEETILKNPVSQVFRGLINGRIDSLNNLFELGDDTLRTLLGKDVRTDFDLIDTEELGTYVKGDEEKPLYFVPKAITQYILPYALVRGQLAKRGITKYKDLISAGVVDFTLTDPFEDNTFNLFTGLNIPILNNMIGFLATPDQPDDKFIAPEDKYFLRLKNGFHAYLFDKVAGAAIEKGTPIAKEVLKKAKKPAQELTGLLGEKLGASTDLIMNTVLDIKANSKRRKLILGRLSSYQNAINADIIADKNAITDTQLIEDLKSFKKLEVKNKKIRAKNKKIEKEIGKGDGSSIPSRVTEEGDIIDPFGYKRSYFAGQFKKFDDAIDYLNSRKGQLDGIEKRTFKQMANEAEQMLPFDAVNAASDIVEFLDDKNVEAVVVKMKQIVFEGSQAAIRYTNAIDTAIATGNVDLQKKLLKGLFEEQTATDYFLNIKRHLDNRLATGLAATRVPPKVPSADQGKGIEALIKYKGQVRQNITVDERQVKKAVDDFISPITNYKLDDLIKLADEGDSKTLRTVMRKVAIAAQDPKAYQKMMKDGFKVDKGQRLLQITNEVFINNILSSPVTHQVNILSTALNSLSRPITLALGAGDDAVLRTRAAKELIYAIQSIQDSIKMAALAFRANTNILDAGSKVLDYDMALLDGKSAFVRSIGNAYRLPTRFLMAEDEFFKQVNFRAFAKAEIWEEGTRKGKTGKQLTNYMDRRFNQLMQLVNNESKTGKFTNKTLDLYRRAREFSASATFTEDLIDGTITKDVSNFVNRHPILRQILPFVRTPANILKQTAKATPVLNRIGDLNVGGVKPFKDVGFYKEHIEEITSPNAAVRARAIGRTRLGGALWISGITSALAINNPEAPIAITGGLSANNEIRKLELATGKQPYSFRFLLKDTEKEKYAENGKPYGTIDINDQEKYVRGADGKLKYKYISYKRIDPWASFFAISADMTQIQSYLPTDNGTAQTIFDVAKIALSRNLVNKTYLQGITELFSNFDDADFVYRFIARRGAILTVPAYNFLKDVKKVSSSYSSVSEPNVVMDKNVYGEEKGSPMIILRRYLNEVASAFPYYNAELRPDQNWITGQLRTYPVGFGKHNWNPLLDGWSTDTETINDPVLSVLSDLNVKISPPVKSLMNGQIPLDKDQYSTLIYLTASEKFGGKRLYDSLISKINTPSMQGDIKTMRGEGITSTNEEVAVLAQERARARVAGELRDILSEYKTKALELFTKKYLPRDIREKLQRIEKSADNIRNDNIREATPSINFAN